MTRAFDLSVRYGRFLDDADGHAVAPKLDRQGQSDRTRAMMKDLWVTCQFLRAVESEIEDRAAGGLVTAQRRWVKHNAAVE